MFLSFAFDKRPLLDLYTCTLLHLQGMMDRMTGGRRTTASASPEAHDSHMARIPEHPGGPNGSGGDVLGQSSLMSALNALNPPPVGIAEV